VIISKPEPEYVRDKDKIFKIRDIDRDGVWADSDDESYAELTCSYFFFTEVELVFTV
jgi:hypothetical protein